MKVCEDIYGKSFSFENNSFIKSGYMLTDFAQFKLCPALYAFSVLFPSESAKSTEQLLLKTEAEILYDAFSEFAKENEETKATFFKNTSRAFKTVSDKIVSLYRKRLTEANDFSAAQISESASRLLDNAQQIFRSIHRWARSDQYTVIGGAEKEYVFDDFSFIYRSFFRAYDCDHKRYKTLYIKELDTFPVFSAGEKHKELIHYSDIIQALNDNDEHTDRVFLAMQIIRKINIQLESTLYMDHGLERIEKLAGEIGAYDFSNPCKKKSAFCSFCRYYGKCF